MILDDGDLMAADVAGELTPEVLVANLKHTLKAMAEVRAAYDAQGWDFRIQTVLLHVDPENPDYTGHQPNERVGQKVTVIFGRIPDEAAVGAEVSLPNMTVQTPGPYGTIMLLKALLNGWKLAKAGDLYDPEVLASTNLL